MKTRVMLLPAFAVGAILVLVMEYQSATLVSNPENGSIMYSTTGIPEESQPSMKDYAQALSLIRQLNETIHRRANNKTISAEPKKSSASALLTASFGNEDNICQTLRYKKTQEIWMANLPRLLEWSIHPFDTERVFVDFHAQLLHLMSPERFERAVKTLPHRYWKSIEAAMEITRLRMNALQRNDTGSPTARKLHILVMGGSVAEGDQCRPKVRSSRPQNRRTCAWPFRLQFMLDRILGENVVEVTAATVGGTNSEAALVVLDYDLVPKEVDVVIHAYATNDMHAYTMEAARAKNVTLRERVFDLTEQFARKVLARCRPSQGPPPLLIHLDDYLGNEQNNILETTHIAQTVPWLANYYGFMHLSYADAVRDLVYANTQETYLSPFWKITNDTNGALYREVHPGMGAHIVISFMVLYSFLHTMTTFCGLPEHAERRWDKKGKLQYEPIGGLPELTKALKLPLFYTPPEQLHGLPPQVYPDLTLDSVTTKWKSAAFKDCSKEYENRCIFAWVSRITPNCMLRSHLDDILARYSVSKKLEWQPEFEFKKLGLVPIAGISSTLLLEFANLTQPVSSIMLMIMKSYGPKWINSTVQLTASHRAAGTRRWKERELSLTEFSGYHDKNTSEQYSYTSKFLRQGANAGDDLRISLKLISGQTSKIMGMAVCST
jgi:hypothetical protein